MSSSPEAASWVSPVETYDVDVRQLVYGGEGLCRLPSGEVIFVPYSAPGDHARVVLPSTSQKPRRGKVVEVLSPSEHRTEPRCSAFGECGGCQWQHLTGRAQLEWKRHIVEESLRRLGNITDVEVSPVLTGESWAYRNKVEWFAKTEGLKTTLGFHRAQSKEVIPFETCHLVPEGFNELYRWLNTSGLYAPDLVSVQVQANTDGQMLVTFHGADNFREPISRLLHDLLAAFPHIEGVVADEAGLHSVLFGSGYLLQRIVNAKFEVSSNSFFQVNPDATLALLQVLDTLLPPSMASMIDLYSGVGLFSVWLNYRVEKILAVEGSPYAVTNAQQNLIWNECQNVEIREGDVERVLPEILDKFEVAIIDPPRKGCDQSVLEWLEASITEKIIYVSCNPATLARDLAFMTQHGWQIETVQPIDMFPQTYHIETIVSLKRNDYY